MTVPKQVEIEKLIELRHELHRIPETAHQEEKTAEYVKKYLSDYPPDVLADNIGGYGIAAIYNGEKPGPTVMLRCELDALPIPEVNEMEYRSTIEGNGHKCGHDGHMAIISGMAQYLHASRPDTGRVILLYQPAEETGEGARKILDDSKFSDLEPDYIYALHNLPGFPKSQILVKKGIFASASKGIIIKLKGRTSHASHPENGENPALAASQIIQSLFMIPQMHTEFHRAALITPIQIQVGKPAFGTSAGEGEVMATLRTHRDEEMEILSNAAEEQAKKIAEANHLKIDISYTEEFEAVKNDSRCVDFIKEVAGKSGKSITEMDTAFPWSEDFGLFTSQFNGALFGLGAGEDHPQLHNDDYDFPDDIIETGVTMFQHLIENILNKAN